MNNTVKGTIESIDQMIDFIETLDDNDYQFCAAPWLESSIGQHLRHIVDLFLALVNQEQDKAVDYEFRRRGASIEISRTTGLLELRNVRAWMNQIDSEDIERPIRVLTEVSINSEQTEIFNSTFGRELCFASSHLTHHLALMAVIAKIAGKSVDPTLGLAPATATHVRNQLQDAACAP